MNKIVAFGGSNSSRSINHQLAAWASAQLENVEVNLLDLNDYEMPIYSIDKERDNGIPDQAHQFKNALREADGIILSLAEHNGSYSAAFKNILDWGSRIERSMWLGKPMFLLASSPGPRGGKNVLSTAVGSFPHQGAHVVASLPLPSFNQNFSPDQGITESELSGKFEAQLSKFITSIHEAKTEKAPTAT